MAESKSSSSERRGLQRTQHSPSLWRPESPFHLMRRFSDEVERMFSGEMRSGDWSPAVETFDRDGQFTVRAELPGLKQEDVHVEIAGDSLNIQGERKWEHEETREGYHRSERSYGSFFRSVPLPPGANTDQARARLDNGVLEVTFPLPESQRRREISIQSSASGERKPVETESAGKQQKSKTG